MQCVCLRYFCDDIIKSYVFYNPNIFARARLVQNTSRDRILGNIREHSSISKTARVAKKIWGITDTIASIWGEKMLRDLSLDIICSWKRTVFLELGSRKTVRFSEQTMSADEYPSLFSRQLGLLLICFCKSLTVFVVVTFKEQNQFARNACVD